MKFLFNKLTILCLSLFISCTILQSNSLISCKYSSVPIAQVDTVITSQPSAPSPLEIRDSIKQDLIKEVKGYIDSNYPKSKLSATRLVEVCDKHNFDIAFAIAQAEIESHLGTTGVAAKTKSPWNVGAYDGRSHKNMIAKGYGYKHPNFAIEPYVLLVKRKYLGETKQVDDLMRNYVTLSGYRYASNKNYEQNLKRKYKHICSATDIRSLQTKMTSIVI